MVELVAEKRALENHHARLKVCETGVAEKTTPLFWTQEECLLAGFLDPLIASQN